VVIGAHPDDCDIDAGGTAILFSKMGHNVKFVSLTNGDAGHYKMSGGELAKDLGLNMLSLIITMAN